jgi:NADH:ubiquinone oxidoreductase subunit 6 (subunit J)
MLEVLLLILTVVSAMQALRSDLLLLSALWLAATSALTALLLQSAGAGEIAVLELSIGAGLITVLFVFAITLTGDNSVSRIPVPRWIAVGLVLGTLIVFAVLIVPAMQAAPPVLTAPELPFKTVLWKERQADLLLQVVLMFACVLTVSGLLIETGTTAATRGWEIPRTKRLEENLPQSYK